MAPKSKNEKQSKSLGDDGYVQFLDCRGLLTGVVCVKKCALNAYTLAKFTYT